MASTVCLGEEAWRSPRVMLACPRRLCTATRPVTHTHTYKMVMKKTRNTLEAHIFFASQVVACHARRQEDTRKAHYHVSCVQQLQACLSMTTVSKSWSGFHLVGITVDSARGMGFRENGCCMDVGPHQWVVHEPCYSYGVVCREDLKAWQGYQGTVVLQGLCTVAVQEVQMAPIGVHEQYQAKREGSKHCMCTRLWMACAMWGCKTDKLLRFSAVCSVLYAQKDTVAMPSVP